MKTTKNSTPKKPRVSTPTMPPEVMIVYADNPDPVLLRQALRALADALDLKPLGSQ